MAPPSQQPSTGITSRTAIVLLGALLLPCLLWNVQTSVSVAAPPLWFDGGDGDGDDPTAVGNNNEQPSSEDRKLVFYRDDSGKDSRNENDESRQLVRTPFLEEKEEEEEGDNKQTHSAGSAAAQLKQQPVKTVDAHAHAAAGEYNTSWCILDKTSTKEDGKFTHFPHALQTLSLCWSWFRTQPATNRCGFYVNGKIGGFGSPDRDWRSALAFQHMGCDLQYSSLPLPTRFPSYRPLLKDVDGRRYFFQPEDTVGLRDRLYAHDSTNQTWSGLHIGIVERKGSRKILNMDAIEAAIREEYPSALIERTPMEGLTPLQQFHWWARQDIVIAGHGAAVANMVFLRRNAAMIEIFPPHYFNLGFWKLGNAMDVRNYGYFNGVEDPIADYKEHCRSFEGRIALRAVDLEPPVDAVLGLVKQAVTEETSGTYREREKYSII
jgi:Glycosyltransferase 61